MVSYTVIFWEWTSGINHPIPQVKALEQLRTGNRTPLYRGKPFTVHLPQIILGIREWLTASKHSEPDENGDYSFSLPQENGYILTVKGNPENPRAYNYIRIERPWGEYTRIMSSSHNFTLEMVI